VKAKKAASLFLALILISATAMLIDKTISLPDPTIFIDPPTIIDMEKNAGTRFSIKINVTDPGNPDGFVYGVHSWDLKIRYNPVLLYTNLSLVEEGPFLKSSGVTIFVKAQGSDYLQLGCTLGSNYDWADGKGALATVTFIVKGLGETTLDLYDTMLNDVNGGAIYHVSQDGYFRNVAEGVAPKASFSHFPTFPLWYENITFDASSSSDSDGTITRYLWYFGDLDPSTQKENTANETDPITYYKYIKTVAEPEKSFTVRLIVIDNTGTTGDLSVKVLTVVSSRAEQDLAIVFPFVSVNSTYVEPGRSLTITVYVGNQGRSSATLNVTAYYDSYEIATQTGVTLNAAEMRPVKFNWNTAGVAYPCVYTLWAKVWPLINETNTSDNTYTFGNIAVTFSPHVSFTHEPDSPYVDEAVFFDASASYDPDGNITSYRWDFFGDENVTTVTTPFVVHRYSRRGPFNGLYMIILTATDNLGATNTTSQMLNVLRIPTAITITVPQVATVGSNLIINGSISPVPSAAEVKITYRPLGAGVWNSLANTTTNAEGEFSHVWSPTEPGTFEFKVGWDGDQKYDGDESDVVVVVVKLRSSISLVAMPSSIRIGENVVLNGSISPVRSGVSVAIVYRVGGGSWNLVGNVVTDQNGNFVYSWKPSAVGVYEIEAIWGGDETTRGSESDLVTVWVQSLSSTVDYVPYILGAGAVAIVTLAVGLVYWKRLKGKRRGENRVFLVSWLISRLAAFVRWFPRVAADVMGLFGSLVSGEVVVSYIRNYQKVQIRWSLMGL